MQCGKNVVILGAGPIGALVQDLVQAQEPFALLIHHTSKLNHAANELPLLKIRASLSVYLGT